MLAAPEVRAALVELRARSSTHRRYLADRRQDLGSIAMPEAFKLDRIDLRILAQLQKNGRMTNVDLADAVGLSPSPCLIRVKRLEQAGYIAGYGAHLRLEKLGDTLTVFTEVTLADHHREDFIRFETAIREVDEILECHLVSGGYDICCDSSRAASTITRR